MSTHNEFHGVIVRGERVTFVCCDCGLFIKHGEQRCQTIYHPCATEPEYEYVHAAGTGCKSLTTTATAKE